MSGQPTLKEFLSEEFDITKYMLMTNDSLTLIQFMRLVKSAMDDSFYLYRNPETIYSLEDFQLIKTFFSSDLKDKIGFIMKNSKNKELLDNTTDLLRLIFKKKSRKNYRKL